MSHNGSPRTCSCRSCEKEREYNEARYEQLSDDAERYEAIRQTVNCPTCGGSGCIVVGQTMGDPYGEQNQCPDCTDGKIPMAWLLKAGANVFAENAAPPDGYGDVNDHVKDYADGWRDAIESNRMRAVRS